MLVEIGRGLFSAEKRSLSPGVPEGLMDSSPCANPCVEQASWTGLFGQASWTGLLNRLLILMDPGVPGIGRPLPASRRKGFIEGIRWTVIVMHARVPT